MISPTCSTTLLFGGLILFLIGKDLEPTGLDCAKSMSSWSPAWEAVEYKWTTFQNSFSQKSIYRGLPSPELEAAWNASLQRRPIFVPVERINDMRTEPPYTREAWSNPTSKPSTTSKAFAYLEVFRNLACLNLLRQHTYREDYDYSHLEAFSGSENAIMERVDACVQRLRQVLLCAGDTTPYLIMLTPEKAQKESPDFNTLHYCRDFDQILEWTREHEVEKEVENRFPALYNFAGA